MKLSDAVDENTIAALRAALADGELAGLTFEQAMTILLTDGIVPTSGLPVESVLRLEDWARERLRTRGPQRNG